MLRSLPRLLPGLEVETTQDPKQALYQLKTGSFVGLLSDQVGRGIWKEAKALGVAVVVYSGGEKPDPLPPCIDAWIEKGAPPREIEAALS